MVLGLFFFPLLSAPLLRRAESGSEVGSAKAQRMSAGLLRVALNAAISLFLYHKGETELGGRM